MRKFLGIAAVVALVLLALAPLAYAQSDAGVRDPFDPLIQPSPAATGIDPTVSVDPGLPVDPVTPVDPLPDTGADAVTWFGLGYALIALGTGAVVVARLYGPRRLAAR
jgi:hypothetical protein